MGMDVYGLAPTHHKGQYFRRSVWGWHPLADCCLAIAPKLTAPCTHWHSNDGAGLDGARRLGTALKEAIDSGSVADYVAKRDAKLAALTDDPCRQCSGTGVRADDIGTSLGMKTRLIDKAHHPRHGETGWCNGCDGLGVTPAWEKHYRLCTDDVAEFADFLLACGGFEIF